jgi:hypothetical protein
MIGIKNERAGIQGGNVAEGAHHKDPAQGWLIFFFVCFGIVLLGIVIFFARDVNDQSNAPAESGGHHGMIIVHDRPVA